MIVQFAAPRYFAIEGSSHEGMLNIGFDDGTDTDYTVAFPEMVSRGMSGTSYIVTNYVSNLEGYVTWEQLYEMQQAGWDLQCHTQSHAHLPQKTDAQIQQEMYGVNEAFIQHGLQPPTQHAYPFGEYDARVIANVRQHRYSMRATGGEMQDYRDIDWTRINAYHGDISQETGYKSLEEFKQRVNQAIAEKQVMLAYWHRLTETTEPYFIAFLDYVQASGIRVVTHAELYSHARYIGWGGYKFVAPRQFVEPKV